MHAPRCSAQVTTPERIQSLYEHVYEYMDEVIAARGGNFLDL